MRLESLRVSIPSTAILARSLISNATTAMLPCSPPLNHVSVTCPSDGMPNVVMVDDQVGTPSAFDSMTAFLRF
jgi:hypothetical protein